MTLVPNTDDSVRKGDLVDQALFSQSQDLAQGIARVRREEEREMRTPQLIICDVVCCKKCREPIDAKRLEAKPYATRCVGCQQEVENAQHN